ncbi:MAG TPA: two-component system response regulator OmpR, partial [Gammaproteobacteria bacterium]|nr:two-component system response regulator OmpR [Gammaproteobacteria bacterium]
NRRAEADRQHPGRKGLEAAARVPEVRGEEEDVRALSLGADDHLTKPFRQGMPVARIRALLSRVGSEGGAP